MKHSIRTCLACGVVLERGETCNCQQPVAHEIHRDGLTATCPLFSHRSSYRGRYFINCVHPGGDRERHTFDTSDERNRVYGLLCCREGVGCPYSRAGEVQEDLPW